MLAAAERVFADVGFHRASMDAIAVEAGISKPMLYNYFGSKQGIYLAYLSRAGRDLVERLLAVDIPDAPTADRLAAGAEAFFGYVDEHRAGWRVLREEMVRQGDTVGGEVATLRAAVTALMAEVLAADGHSDPGDVDAFAHALTGAGESLADWWLENPGTPVEIPVGTLTAMAARLPRADKKVA